MVMATASWRNPIDRLIGLAPDRGFHLPHGREQRGTFRESAATDRIVSVPVFPMTAR